MEDLKWLNSAVERTVVSILANRTCDWAFRVAGTRAQEDAARGRAMRAGSVEFADAKLAESSDEDSAESSSEDGSDVEGSAESDDE